MWMNMSQTRWVSKDRQERSECQGIDEVVNVCHLGSVFCWSDENIPECSSSYGYANYVEITNKFIIQFNWKKLHCTGMICLPIDIYISIYLSIYLSTYMLNFLNWPLCPRMLSFKNREIGILIWTQNLGIYFEQISVC